MQWKARFVGLVLGALAIGNSVAIAGSELPFELNIEPVVGYERVQQIIPYQHTVNRFFYGAIVTAGVMMVSLEAAYTRSMNQETLSGTDINSTGDKVKVGLRSGIRLTSLVSAYLRAGGEASQETTVQTINGVTTTDYTGVRYRPYAGLGGKVALSSRIYGTADVVAVFPSLSDFSQTEYQATAGFALRLP